jgi:hypothetical protein
MAHFAELDENNVVKQVVVVNNDVIQNLPFPESEPIGVAFCQSLFGGNWKQTSYNASFRKQYAGIGYIYDVNHDAFLRPQPYPWWVLNENLEWYNPHPRPPYPTDGNFYVFDDATESWVILEGVQIIEVSPEDLP